MYKAIAKISQHCERLDVLAVVTWGLVLAISLYALPSQTANVQANTLGIAICFAAYIVCFFGATKLNKASLFGRAHQVFLGLQLASAFAIMLMLPLDFIPILTIIWAGMLINFCRFETALLIIIALVVVWFSLYGWRWQKDHVLLTGSLYGTFHIFSLLMSQQTQKAKQASEQANELNRQLLATQQLLTQSTKQHERTRIARELHDLLGHHLTALTINLQVSSHLCERDGNSAAKEKVDESYALAKLLLSDVREAVSTIKANQAIDVQSAIEALVAGVPALKVHHSIQTDIQLDSFELANTLVRISQEAITNTLRHSGASEFWLSITQQRDEIQLKIYDNGTAPAKLVAGNGLSGITERAELLGGTVNFNRENDGLTIVVNLPNHIRQ
ncbi:sensor histidine kinase [Thalassotalea euphylliae]|uniref:Sensor histidine kinase n=1 Tax=Thalassotalea euphylliae TaxID=1655234 RepID=A0A3E0U1D6_9GAMM|nr:sensor histidine kinase [Thalassotalea euphylliae]REL30771.1 sensor histidine kinase [Thalassotalea euphylliae]